VAGTTGSYPRRFGNQNITFGHNNLRGNSLTVSRFGYLSAGDGRDYRLGNWGGALMARGPLALFGAIVAVGLGPALWLGAQFGRFDVAPPSPPVPVDRTHDDTAQLTGGTGGGVDETGNDSTPVRSTPRAHIMPLTTSPSPSPSSSPSDPRPSATTSASDPASDDPSDGPSATPSDSTDPSDGGGNGTGGSGGGSGGSGGDDSAPPSPPASGNDGGDPGAGTAIGDIPQAAGYLPR
jgi:hypothetical protein